jgi:hypothetical protein
MTTKPRVSINKQIDILLNEFKSFNLDFDVLVSETVGDVAEGVKKRAVKSINRKTKGKKYGTHIAGQKGKAPNSESGDLARSLKTQQATGDLTAFVGTEDDGAMALETIYKHPFLRPALRKGKNDFKRKIRANLKAAIARHRND